MSIARWIVRRLAGLPYEGVSDTAEYKLYMRGETLAAEKIPVVSKFDIAEAPLNIKTFGAVTPELVPEDYLTSRQLDELVDADYKRFGLAR